MFSNESKALFRRSMGLALLAVGAFQCSRAENGEAVQRAQFPVMTPPAMSPPELTASAAVGSIPGRASVGLNGQFSYDIEIEVPEGRAGFTPKLSLNYQSNNPDGIAGVGWTLGGLSSISRCSKIKAAGGAPERIRFTHEDAFCLDGQRLVLVEGTAGNITARYRTEFDSGVVVSPVEFGPNGPTNWEALTPDGRQTFYRLPDGQVVARRHYDDAGNPHFEQDATLIWPIHAQYDGLGNRILYDFNMAGAVPLPLTIDYTQCASGSCPFSRTRRIRFLYDPRPPGDQPQRWINGVEFTRDSRLTDIVVSIRDDEDDLHELHRYTLEYVQSAVSGRSLLSKLELCDANEICKPRTLFDWQGQAAYEAGYDVYNYGVGGQQYTGNVVKLAYDSPNSPSQEVGESAIALYDANGDGNDDLLLKHWDTQSDGTLNFGNYGELIQHSAQDMLLLADGGGYFEPPIAIDYDGDGITRGEEPCGDMEILDPGATIPVDLDGDGILELVAQVNTVCAFPRMMPGIATHNPVGHGWAVIGWDESARSLRRRPVPDIDALRYTTQIRFGDLNGDGLPELLTTEQSVQHRWHAFRAFVQSRSPAELPQVAYASAGYDTLLPGSNADYWFSRPVTHDVFDEDGDGRQDLVQTGLNSVQGAYRWSQAGDAELRRRDVDGQITLFFTTSAANPETPPDWPLPPPPETEGVTGIWHRIDVNGDGLKDALYRERDTALWKLRTNTGNGYTAPRDAAPGTNALTGYLADEKLVSGRWMRGLDNGLRIADMNGDGRDDIILLHNPQTGFSYPLQSNYTIVETPIRVLYSNGSSYYPPVELPYERCLRMYEPNQRWPMTAVGDIDGNGLADVVEFCADETDFRRRKLRTYRSAHLFTGVDLIRRVYDEFGVAASITYDTMSDGSGLRLGTGVHTPATHYRDPPEDCEYPAACISKGRVVASFQDFRQARDTHSTYRYRGARVDVQGRGPLGPKTAEATDLLSGRTSSYELDHEAVERLNGAVRIYPNIGLPARLFVGLPGDEPYFGIPAPVGGLSTETTIWTRDVYADYPLLPRREIQELKVSQDGTLRRQYLTRQEFDPEFPLPTLLVRETTDHDTGVHTTVETTTEYYPAGTEAQLVGRPSRTIVHSSTDWDLYFAGCTSTPCSESSVTVDYTYFPGSRKVETETRTYDGGEALLTRNTFTTGGLLTHQSLEGSGETRVTEFSHDPSGSYVEGVRNPLGHETWTLHDPLTGRVFAEVDPNGVATILTRDTFGRVTRKQRADGSQTDYSYATGKVTEVVLDGPTTSVTVDFRGRPILKEWSTFDGGTAQERTAYSSLFSTTGDPVLVEYSDGGSFLQLRAFTYDRLGRVVLATNGESEHSQHFYGPEIGTADVIDPKGNLRRKRTDAFGHVIHAAQFSTVPTQAQVSTGYRYNELGKLAAVVPGDLATRAVERMYHDALGRQTSWTSDGTLRLGTTYNAFGEADLIERDGLLIDQQFDKLGRLKVRTELGTTETQTYFYDQGVGAVGQISSATGATGHQTTFTYNELGQLETRRELFTSGESLSFGYSYDDRGRVDTLRYPETPVSGDTFNHAATGGLTVRYGYQNGQLASITQVGAGDPVLWRATQRHVYGKIKQQQDAAGVVTTIAYYPNTLRLQSKTVTGITSGTVPNQQFFYEINGQIQSVITGNGAINETYTYTGFDQLWKYHRDGSFSIIDSDFNYRPSGELENIQTGTASQIFSFAGPDKSRVTRRDFGPNRYDYGYDTAGRVQTVTHPTVTRTYNYNSFNLPITIQDTGGPLFSFGYDAFGKRVTKTRATTQRASYVGDLYEQRAINGGINESVFRLQTGEGIVGEIAKSWTNGNVTRRMLQTDHQGSPQAQTVGTVSTLTGGFAPFGGRLGPAPAQLLSNYGYTGHIADYDLQLLNMKGRIYDPQLRRFLTRDAVLDNPELIAGTSPYAYVRNNPTNFTDPTGLMSSGDPSPSMDGTMGLSPLSGGNRGPSPSQAASIEAGQREAAAAAARKAYLDSLSEGERREWEYKSNRQTARQGLEMQLGYHYSDIIDGWLSASTMVSGVVVDALERGWKFEFGYNGPGIAGMTYVADTPTADIGKTIRLSGVGGYAFGHELGHFLHHTYLNIKGLRPGAPWGDGMFSNKPAILDARAEFDEGYAEMVAIWLGLGPQTSMYNNMDLSGMSLQGAPREMGRIKLESSTYMRDVTGYGR